MAQEIKILATKPDDLSLILRICMIERENQFLKLVPWPPPVYHGRCMYTCVCLLPYINK